MKGQVAGLFAIVVIALSLLPAAGANHLGQNGGCTVLRSTMVLGGSIAGVGQPGGIYSQCHNQVFCNGNVPCTFEITLTVTGVGLVDGRLFPYNGDAEQTCPLTPGECTLTYASVRNFDLHFDCGIGEQTTAVNVMAKCDAHWVA